MEDDRLAGVAMHRATGETQRAGANAAKWKPQVRRTAREIGGEIHLVPGPGSAALVQKSNRGSVSN